MAFIVVYIGIYFLSSLSACMADEIIVRFSFVYLNFNQNIQMFEKLIHKYLISYLKHPNLYCSYSKNMELILQEGKAPFNFYLFIA